MADVDPTLYMRQMREQLEASDAQVRARMEQVSNQLKTLQNQSFEAFSNIRDMHLACA
jgi:hypothetical protein